MSQYSVRRINYIASGKDRTLVNMDVQLNAGDIYDYVHLLAIEEFGDRPDARLSDVLLEQRGGEFYKTRFIEAETTRLSVDPDHPCKEDYSYEDIDDLERHWSENKVSTYLSALAVGPGPDAVMLNEQQQYYNERLSSDQKWIRLTLSCCTEEYRRRLTEFKAGIVQFEKTYAIEHDQANRGKNVVTETAGGPSIEPIYEFEDVMVKSSDLLQKSILPDFDSSLQYNPSRTFDIYLPRQAQPTDFCQIGDQTYMLSRRTESSPVMLEAEFESKYQSTSKHYHMDFKSENLSTVLYERRDGESYASFLSSGGDMFAVRKSIPGVEYSYVSKIPMSKIVKSYSVTDYDNGNVYAAMTNTKSAYNALYSMEMPSDSEIVNCREYSGVMTCAGRPYLKYRDRLSYDAAGRHEGLATYPKIESFKPVATKSSKEHKSYFFSVNVKDVYPSDLEYDENTASNGTKNFDKFKKEVKHDITEAVRAIVRNVCPVQTQLFEVQFGGQA